MKYGPNTHKKIVRHKSVLINEAIKYLNPKSGENFIDCNLGLGGHSRAILEKTDPTGKVLGIDLDDKTINQFRSETALLDLEKRLIVAQGNFSELKKIKEENKFEKVAGVLFDLGLSSWQLEQSHRGFSFQNDEPLLMNYDRENKLTAEEIVNDWPEEKIADILFHLGEERFSRKIAKKIVANRKIKRIKTTGRLVEVIKYAVPGGRRRGTIHFATRTFQALRIAVNNELENLEKALPQALEILESGGRLVVISFHSLEDRIVKDFFRDNRELLNISTKKPIQAQEEELKSNPRSRSAKLRAAIKI